MTVLLGSSRFLVAYVHVILLLILIMNVLNNYCMLLMTVWGMKITALEESADFATLDTEKLLSKLKSHELCKKGRLNHDASLTSKAFVTSTRVGGHVANPTNTTDSSDLKFALSFLSAASKSMVCEWFGLKTTGMVFSGLTSKPVAMVSGGLASKPAATVFGGLASKSVATVSISLGSKPAVTVSPSLASKPVVGFLVEPQNQGGGGFPGLGLKISSFSLVIWTSKSP
jgi:hypothetical protein